MSKLLHNDLEKLDRHILAMSSMVEEMIEKACQALRNKDPELAKLVIDEEREVDHREVQVEEECLKILALHQPVAIDLRRTATVLKINSDLERIADLAVNICERAQSLAAHPEFAIPPGLERMVGVATSMVHNALDAFVKLDVEAARAVCETDDTVDTYNMEVIDELYRIMRADSKMVEAGLHFFSAARMVERIADHATNIAEDVIYLVEGAIARHQHAEMM